MHSEILQKLADKLADKSFTLGVIGLGYVGIPLSLTFLRKDVRVLGFDLEYIVSWSPPITMPTTRRLSLSTPA